jgi:hypothetical protein
MSPKRSTLHCACIFQPRPSERCRPRAIQTTIPSLIGLGDQARKFLAEVQLTAEDGKLRLAIRQKVIPENYRIVCLGNSGTIKLVEGDAASCCDPPKQDHDLMRSDMQHEMS